MHLARIPEDTNVRRTVHLSCYDLNTNTFVLLLNIQEYYGIKNTFQALGLNYIS